MSNELHQATSYLDEADQETLRRYIQDTFELRMSGKDGYEAVPEVSEEDMLVLHNLVLDIASQVPEVVDIQRGNVVVYDYDQDTPSPYLVLKVTPRSLALRRLRGNGAGPAGSVLAEVRSQTERDVQDGRAIVVDGMQLVASAFPVPEGDDGAQGMYL